ncbi:MAG: hypothetical protein PHQ35_03820 [Phycisphaerae bacterium]|nr:hypothetical protein [Phycisphaerae bacterium]MDD5380579.1 hypothetical protein [Phycisphaerae bacterium]
MEALKKARFKKWVYLLSAVLAVIAAIIVVIFAMLLHRPAYYKPLDYAHSKEISLYLTNELLPELYNGAQLQEPFDLVVTQSGINDIVARFDWPQDLGSVKISAPMMFFSTGSVVLMATVVMDGAELVGTVVAEPALDAEGLLNLHVASVQVGAVDITPLARVLARSICQQRFAEAGIGAEDVQTQIAASLLDDKPFKPVFDVEDKKVRVDKITLEPKKLTIHFAPAFD